MTGAIIKVIQKNPTYEWSASLWYMKPNNFDNYRWYEVQYSDSPFSGKRHVYVPFAAHSIEEAGIASPTGMRSIQIVWGPIPVDDENAGDFFKRWASLLAKASQGKLVRPTHLPLHDKFFE